MAQYLHFRT